MDLVYSGANFAPKSYSDLDWQLYSLPLEGLFSPITLFLPKLSGFMRKPFIPAMFVQPHGLTEVNR